MTAFSSLPRRRPVYPRFSSGNAVSRLETAKILSQGLVISGPPGDKKPGIEVDYCGNPYTHSRHLRAPTTFRRHAPANGSVKPEKDGEERPDRDGLTSSIRSILTTGSAASRTCARIALSTKTGWRDGAGRGVGRVARTCAPRCVHRDKARRRRRAPRKQISAAGQRSVMRRRNVGRVIQPGKRRQGTLAAGSVLRRSAVRAGPGRRCR